jgi:hypothetical protein
VDEHDLRVARVHARGNRLLASSTARDDLHAERPGPRGGADLLQSTAMAHDDDALDRGSRGGGLHGPLQHWPTGQVSVELVDASHAAAGSGRDHHDIGEWPGSAHHR